MRYESFSLLVGNSEPQSVKLADRKKTMASLRGIENVFESDGRTRRVDEAVTLDKSNT